MLYQWNDLARAAGHIERTAEARPLVGRMLKATRAMKQQGDEIRHRKFPKPASGRSCSSLFPAVPPKDHIFFKPGITFLCDS